MKFFHLLVIVFTFLFSVAAVAAPNPSTTLSVQIDVSAKNYENEIYSYISRELRSLGDVQITQDNPDWIINVLAFEPRLKDGYRPGIIFAVAHLRMKKTVSGRSLPVYTGTRIYYGPYDIMKDLCQEMVADFDTRVIEYLRQLNETRSHLGDLESDIEL